MVSHCLLELRCSAHPDGDLSHVSPTWIVCQRCILSSRPSAGAAAGGCPSQLFPVPRSIQAPADVRCRALGAASAPTIMRDRHNTLNLKLQTLKGALKRVCRAQAAFHGVPIVGIPVFGDQRRLNAAWG